MITPAQCRAARALLDWSPERLGRAADVDASAIVQFEGGGPPRDRLEGALQLALETAGVEFTRGEGEGVRLGGEWQSQQPRVLREVGPESEVRGGPEAPGETLR